MFQRTFIWLVNGVVFGISFAAGNELFRIYRGDARICKTCAAPVRMDGNWRGERETRRFSIAWDVVPGGWTAKEKKRKCFGCKKSLDSTSIIVLDRPWHQKCLKCALCNKQMSGNHYYMINNQIYDSTCYEHIHSDPKIQRRHTFIDYQIPAPIQPDDEVHLERSSRSEHHRFRLLQRNSSTSQKHHCNVQSGGYDEPGKMSHEMKKKLANDLLSTLMALRVRELRKKNQEENLTEKEQGNRSSPEH